MLPCGEEPSLWLSKVLNRQCSLAKQNPHHQRFSRTSQNDTNEAPLSLANEAQYLFVSDASVRQLLGDIQQSCVDMGELTEDSLMERFRPNLVLSSSSDLSPYAEESWDMLRIGEATFKVRPSVAWVKIQVTCVVTVVFQ